MAARAATGESQTPRGGLGVWVHRHLRHQPAMEPCSAPFRPTSSSNTHGGAALLPPGPFKCWGRCERQRKTCVCVCVRVPSPPAFLTRSRGVSRKSVRSRFLTTVQLTNIGMFFFPSCGCWYRCSCHVLQWANESWCWGLETSSVKP